MLFLLYIPLVLIFFYVDVCIASVYGQPCSAILVTLVAPYIFLRWPLWFGMPLVGLLCLQSFLYQEVVWLPFWYVAPVLCLSWSNRYLFYNDKMIYTTALFCSILHQILICGIQLNKPWFLIINLVFAEIVALFYTKRELR